MLCGSLKSANGAATAGGQMAHAIGLRGLAKMPASLGCAMGLQVCKRFGWVFRLPPFNGLRDYRKTGQGSLKTVFPVFRLPQRVSAVI